jgi:hypothetical protein
MAVMSTAAAAPAFEGANFDGSGGCLRHPEIRLMMKVTAGGGGTVVYKELMRRCPRCVASFGGGGAGPTTPGATTSPSSPRSPGAAESSHARAGGIPTTGAAAGNVARHSPGGPSSGVVGTNAIPSSSSGGHKSRVRSKSPAARGVAGDGGGRDENENDDDDDDDGRSRSSNGSRWRRLNGGAGGGGRGRDASVSRSPARARSRSATRRPRRVYDTPFDVKGRCHHHPNMQLAKKKLTGGWKVNGLMDDYAPRFCFVFYPNHFRFTNAHRDIRSINESRSLSHLAYTSGPTRTLSQMPRGRVHQQHEQTPVRPPSFLEVRARGGT